MIEDLIDLLNGWVDIEWLWKDGSGRSERLIVGSRDGRMLKSSNSTYFHLASTFAGVKTDPHSRTLS